MIENEAMSAAKESDNRRARGELKSSIDGVPGSLKDVICTAIILIECDDFGSGKILFEVEDILVASAAP